MNVVTARHYFWFSVISLVSHQLYGLLDSLFLGPESEHWADRIIVTIPIGFYLFYLWKNEFRVEHPERFFYLLTFIVTIHYIYLISKTQYTMYYFDGHFILLLACSSLIFHRAYLIFYLLASIGLTIGLVYHSPIPYSQNLLAINFASFGFFLLVLQMGKIQVLKTLGQAFEHNRLSKKQLEVNYQKNLQAAHDLRSPISAINAVASTIQYENKKAHRLLESSVERINQIGDALLIQHKEQKVAVDQDFFDLENNISQIVEDKRREYQANKDFFIYYRLTAPLVDPVKLSKAQFHRVLSNLINNSVEAMDEQTTKRISLIISPGSRDLLIEIVDNGKGIPEELQPKIFDMDVTSKERGTGLGLYHAKKTVENWGGQLVLKKSNADGSIFHLTIPYQS